MKMNRRFATTLILVLTLVLAACSSGPSSSDGGNTADSQKGNQANSKTDDNAYEVALYFIGQDQKDLQLVQDEISKISKEKINANVKLTNINWGNWSQQTTLMLAGNEKMDLMVTSTPFYNYNSQVAKGQLVPLDDLLASHGDGILKAMDPAYLDAAKVNGKIYGIPSHRDMAASYGLIMRKDLLDKYGIDASNVKNFDDVEKVFAQIKEKDPNITPIVPSQGGSALFENFYPAFFDLLGDGLGVLNYSNGDSLKVVNLYESAEYKELVTRARKWNQLGYIAKDAATTKEALNELIKADKAFSGFGNFKPGYDVQVATATGVPIQLAELYPARSTTNTVTIFMFSIPKNSENPEKAMEFLNLMYTDADVVNLLDYGVEGKHYVKKGNVINFPDGVNSNNSGFNLQQGWMFGNQFLSHVWEGNPEDIWDQQQAFNKAAKPSPALGFAYNPDSVKTEVAAVLNVISQYRMSLETGSVDPEKILPKFINDLKAAGVDKIITEKQRQLDEWAKNK
jgi:putative aldouronate transport system substrate-binding protein